MRITGKLLRAYINDVFSPVVESDALYGEPRTAFNNFLGEARLYDPGNVVLDFNPGELIIRTPAAQAGE